MPRVPSDVWKHFTLVRKEGKELYLCKYCSQQYVKMYVCYQATESFDEVQKVSTQLDITGTNTTVTRQT